MRIGATIFRFRWHVAAAWLVAMAALLLFVPPADPTAGLTRDLLPADSPFYQALNEYAERFGDKSGMSEVVIIFERPDAALTPQDLADAEQVGKRLMARIEREGPNSRRDITIHTPKSLAMMKSRNPLLSSDGKAAMACLLLPHKDTSSAAAHVVDRVHAVVDDFPFTAGLKTAITGSAGFCRDYLVAHERSHNRTLTVTVIAIVLVLLLVYRAPLAAAIPLAAVGILTAITTRITILGQSLGFSTGTAERLFMLLLLFGAGVDYSLLFIGRYKEYLRVVRSAKKAFIFALDTSCGAIAASAATTAAGLAALCLARFGVFRDVGPAIVLALLTAGFASITLVPAMVAIVGPALFWPRQESRDPQSFEILREERIWPALADFVTRRAGYVMLLTSAVLAGPVLHGATLSWSYDAHSSLPDRYSASRGMDLVRRHWSVGEISQTRVLIASPVPHSILDWISISTKIVANLRGTPGLSDVRGLTAPLGLRDSGLANIAAGVMGGKRIASEFASQDGRAIWFSATLNCAPQSPEALAALARIQKLTEQTLAAAQFPARTHFTGATAETADLRDVTQSDFRRVSVLSLSVILLIVALLLRDLPLSVFMVAATVVGYLATLGVTAWVFQILWGSGLDWEVEVFLFIVMVAVGQDYNLFFAVRLAQESRNLDLVAATSRALVHTGSVISSCGVIMAATLGSMVVGEIKMLQQLGFALGLGMLIDTFVVRPLLLPAFIVLTRRTISKAAGFLHPTVERPVPVERSCPIVGVGHNQSGRS